MSDFEDDDHTTFLKLDGLDVEGDSPVVSRAAFQLHTAGLVNSVRDGHPGFVADEYLEAISADTTLTALELCTAGLWERADGGYTVLDQQGLDMALRAHEHVARIANEDDEPQ